MDHALNKKIIYLFLILTLQACTNRPEDQLIEKLETRYANLYYNNESKKREALENLRKFFQKNALSDARLDEVHVYLNRINDGHVVLFDSRPEKNIVYESQLKFVPGSMAIKSCQNCVPVLHKGKYEILEVNKDSLERYFEKERDSVAASSDWGREFRLSRLLVSKSNDREEVLKVKDEFGHITTTTVPFTKSALKAPVCVSGERLGEKIFKLNIYSLWCDDLTEENHSREQILENFKKQFDIAVSAAKSTDHIIIDLRENGGGGDYEVEYVLNAFIEKSAFMYHYRYLRKTHPGKRKWLEKIWPFKLALWSEAEYQYSDPSKRGPHTFFSNKVTTLVSAGCFSSCEGIASSLKSEKRSVLIGEKTHGGAGDPVIFPIADTPYSINIPTCVVWQKDGSLFEGVGVMPDITLSQNLKTTDDNVLRRAIDQVQ